MDLDPGYLFGLSLSPPRDAGAWAQGLSLSVVVKHAAKGIAAGVAEVFPHAEQRDDCFHVLYEMNKVQRKLERRADAALEREGAALGRLGKIRARDKTCRRKAKCALRKARRQCTGAIERFDAFAAAMDRVRGALECLDVASGELHRPEHIEALIAQAAGQSGELGTGQCTKLARYLRNRAPGPVLAQKSVGSRLEALGEQWSMPAVCLGCLCWYLVRALNSRVRHARCRALSRHLLGAYAALQDHLGPESASLLDAIEAVRHQCHRASSAVEGFNAALRPYLYVHKGVTQGFLNLFRAGFNLRTRRRERHKGTSAHQSLTEQSGSATGSPCLATRPRQRSHSPRALTRPHLVGHPDPEHCVPRDVATRMCKDESSEPLMHVAPVAHDVTPDVDYSRHAKRYMCVSPEPSA